MAIGDFILDLRGCVEGGHFDALAIELRDACAQASLNALMALGAAHGSALRQRVSELLSAEAWRGRVEPLLIARKTAVLCLPVEIGDYSDFFASLHHASNVGRLFRPENPLLPNYKYVPIGYHGRASSIVVSGAAVRRPWGQRKDGAVPVFEPSRALDYELEVGVFVGRGNALGNPIPIGEAESHLFGLCLLNDWSARDLQSWESQPLGPFLAKSFATSISPWIVPMAALEPFRTAAAQRAEGEPAPLDYLSSAENRQHGGIDITLEVYLSSALMRAAGHQPMRLSRSHFRDLYWTMAQLLTHQTSNGCNLRTGDLLGSGTASGPEADAMACLLEMTRGGAARIRLPNGEERAYLQDGDEVILRGVCEREGFVRIGFGECRGVVGPARDGV